MSKGILRAIIMAIVWLGVRDISRTRQVADDIMGRADVPPQDGDDDDD